MTPPFTRAMLSADKRYEYTDAAGVLEFVVCRWNAKPDQAKRFAQYHHDGKAWVAKAPPAERADGTKYLRPLYDLPALAADPATPVLVVEGEKAWAAALNYLPEGWHATTWAGGANAIDKTDWTPLAGRKVHIWPDNDEAGFKAAHKIARLTGGWIIPLPPLPEKWDLADPLPADLTAENIREIIIREPPPPPKLIEVPVAAPDLGHLDVPGFPEPRGERMSGPDIDLPFDFARTERGTIKPTYGNAVFMLRKHPGKWNLRFDSFARRPVRDENALTDDDIREIAEWMQYEGISVSVNVVADAVFRYAKINSFHPVQEYLNSLVWDEIPRIDHLLIDHAGANDDDHGVTRAFTAKWLIQAVARIYDPGCHARATLVLEGPQDIGKSTIYRELFGDRWFTDHLPDLTSKDALIQLRGTWCVEIAELATLGRSDTARIKQFLTSRVDRYRDPYGRLVSDYPRTCVFGGTVNPGARGYLKDETGGTRFWPIAVTKIDLPAFTDKRDQIWAEAIYRYRRQEPWHLNGELVAAASEIQADRYEGDPWHAKIEKFVGQRSETTIVEIFDICLDMHTPSEWSQADMNRIARCLGALDWVRHQRRDHGKRVWVYMPRHQSGDNENQPELGL